MNSHYRSKEIRMTRIRTIGFYLITILFLANLAGCGNKQADEQAANKIGVLLPLTGPLAEYGERVKKGVDLAIERIKKEPDGKGVEFIIVDSKAEPNVGLSAFRQMNEVNGVHYVMGDVSSSVTLSIVPLLEKQKVLMLSPAASSSKLSGASTLFARAWPTNDLEASAVARRALADGCKSLASVVVNVDYGVGLGDTFKRIFREGGGNVILDEGFPLGNADYRTIWQKVGRSKPQCVYFVGHKPEIIAAMNQYAETGLRFRLYGNTNFEDDEIIATVGKPMEGIIFGTATLDTASGEPTVKAFIDAYKIKYGSEPTLYSANGFDLVNLAVELQRKHGTDVAGAMTDLKQRNEIKGAAGTFRILGTGDVQRPIAIKTVQNGAYQTLGYE